MDATGVGVRAWDGREHGGPMGSGKETAPAARLGAYPGVGSDGDHTAEYDPSHGRDTDRWVGNYTSVYDLIYWVAGGKHEDDDEYEEFAFDYSVMEADRNDPR